MAEKLNGFSTAGLFGYSHIYGGYAGGQAQYVRVPFADVGPFKVPDELPDEQVLFLTDIFPTGYMAAENCDIQAGRYGGGLGLRARSDSSPSAARSCSAPGGSSPSIDVAGAARDGRATAGPRSSTESEGDVLEKLRDMTGGRGPDACIDAVGMEAHGHGAIDWYDKVKQAVGSRPTGRSRCAQAIEACRKGGHRLGPGRLRRACSTRCRSAPRSKRA